VSAYWINHVPDLFYLSGYASEGCWGLIGSKFAAMIVPGLALDQAKAIAKGFNVLSVKKASDAYNTLISLAKDNKAAAIGYDPFHTPEAHINALRKASGTRLKWVPIPAATTPIRI